jgi:hypothetical protein
MLVTLSLLSGACAEPTPLQPNSIELTSHSRIDHAPDEGHIPGDPPTRNFIQYRYCHAVRGHDCRR